MGSEMCIRDSGAHIASALIARGNAVIIVALDVEEMQMALVLRTTASATHALDIPDATALRTPQRTAAALGLRARLADVRHGRLAPADRTVNRIRLIGIPVNARPTLAACSFCTSACIPHKVRKKRRRSCSDSDSFGK